MFQIKGNFLKFYLNVTERKKKYFQFLASVYCKDIF